MCHCLYRQSCSMLQLLLLWDLWPFSCCAEAVVGHRRRLLPGPKACSGLSATAAPHSALEPVVTLLLHRNTHSAALQCKGPHLCILLPELRALPASSVSSGVGHGMGMALLGPAPAVRVSEGSHRGSTCREVGQPGCAREGLGAGTVGVSTAGGSSSLPPLVGLSALGAPVHSQSILPGTSELGAPVPGARGCSRTGAGR